MSATSPSVVVLAAGGTGGHVYPAEALARALLALNYRVVWFTDRRGGAVGGALDGIETRRIRSGAIAGTGPVSRARSLLSLGLGAVQARQALARLAPSAAIGFGGYASVPTMMAATFAGLPTLIHEQNAVLGRANRLLARRVNRIALSYERTDAVPATAADKCLSVGMPVRPAFALLAGQPYPPTAAGDAVKILVIGGSQGARIFSDVLPAAVATLAPETRGLLAIAQQCRPEDLDRTRDTYRDIGIHVDLATFFDDVPTRLSQSHLLIGRAGASTVAEATTVGRPAVLVPYPYATDDHQTANARALASADAGWLMAQESFTGDALAEFLAAIVATPTMLREKAERARALGRPDATDRLARAVIDLAQGNGANAERRAA